MNAPSTEAPRSLGHNLTNREETLPLTPCQSICGGSTSLRGVFVIGQSYFDKKDSNLETEGSPASAVTDSYPPATAEAFREREKNRVDPFGPQTAGRTRRRGAELEGSSAAADGGSPHRRSVVWPGAPPPTPSVAGEVSGSPLGRFWFTSKAAAPLRMGDPVSADDLQSGQRLWPEAWGNGGERSGSNFKGMERYEKKMPSTFWEPRALSLNLAGEYF